MNFDPKTWQPLAIDAFGHVTAQGTPSPTPAEYLRIYTADGGIIIAKRCPLPERITCSGSKPVLYCSRDGRFFSLSGGGTTLREVKPSHNPSCQISRPNMHTAYPRMRSFGSRLCHHLMYETWIGPRTKGMEIDHINGNMMDWSLDNLEEVTPAENRKRAKLLRVLRSIGREPKQMSREELQAIFKRYEFEDSAKRMEYEMNHHCEE